MAAETRLVSVADVAAVAMRMRARDRAEVLASDGLTAAQALHLSLAGSSFARTLVLEGQVAALFGVRWQDEVGVVWTLTTPVVDEHPAAFARASRRIVAQLRERFGTLVQCIDARYSSALRWARWLGFHVEPEPHACGLTGMPFHLAVYGG